MNYFTNVFLYTTALIGLFVVSAVCGGVVVAHAAETNCTSGYTATTPAEPGFGTAYSFFSANKDLLLRSTCVNDTTAVVSLGHGAVNQYVLATGYYWSGSAWIPFALHGGSPVGAWFKGDAAGIIPLQGKETIFIGYVCEQVGGAWKCGCHDAACTQPSWQLQTIIKPQVPVVATSTSNTSAGSSQSSSQNSSQNDSSASVSNGTYNKDAWLMGYYVGYQANDYPPEEIDFNSITHITAGRISPHADGTVTTDFNQHDDAASAQVLSRVARLAHRKDVKALLWVAGPDTDVEWSQAIGDTTRVTFVKNLVQTMEDLGYDGLDLNFEPIATSDEENVRLFLKELRREAPDALITMPIPWIANTRDRSKDNELYAEYARYLDRLFIMSYSMSGQWPGWDSWHNSALYGDTLTTPTSVQSSVATYLKAGVPAAKLGFGVGYYAQCYKAPVNAPHEILGSLYPTGSITTMSYRTFITDYYNKDAYRFDDVAKVPYLSFATSTGALGCGYITYDDERSIAEKAKYLHANGLGGMMIWTLGMGYLPDKNSGDRQDLLQATYRAVIERRW